jgi:hypothetical protein
MKPRQKTQDALRRKCCGNLNLRAFSQQNRIPVLVSQKVIGILPNCVHVHVQCTVGFTRTKTNSENQARVAALVAACREFRVNCQHCTLEHTKAHTDRQRAAVEDALFAEETLHTRSGRAQASGPWPKACAAMAQGMCGHGAPGMAPVRGRCFGLQVVSRWSPGGLVVVSTLEVAIRATTCGELMCA